MSDTMDSCHLVGLYRTTKTPGQLVLEPGLLTGAITACDLRGAPDSRSGLSTAGVPALSDPAKSRGLESMVREELAKLGTLQGGEDGGGAGAESSFLEQVVGRQCPALAPLTHKVLRLFTLVTCPSSTLPPLWAPPPGPRRSPSR